MIDREEKWEKVAERMAILKEQGVPYIFVVWSEGLPILDVMLTTNVEPFFWCISFSLMRFISQAPALSL